MIGWLLNQLIEAVAGYVAQFCTWVVSQIASEGLVIFDQPVIQGIINKIYTIGLGLWGIGCILAVFDLAIQYTKGSTGGVMDYCMNFVKGFLAANLFYALPIPVYRLFVKMGENIGYAITGSSLFYSDMWGSDAFTGNLLTGAVRALLVLIVHLIMLICLIIVYFKFLSVVTIGSIILTINYRTKGFIDRYRFCSIDDKSLRSNVKRICKAVINSGYNYALLKGLNAEIVEEESLELNPAVFDENDQGGSDSGENESEQFTEAEKVFDSKPAKAGTVAAGVQAIKPKIAAFFGEVKNLMNGARGNGYAAEYANNTMDRALGKNVESAAQNLDEHGRQVKAGADRLVNGVEIQTKYYKTASESIGAAFEKKQAIYIRSDGSGKMMQIEVPRDQYNEALELMQKRIDKGQVPNVAPGEDARNYVRKGFFTYEQSFNIARAGTIESLTVDAVSGAVCCAAAASITSVIVFAISVWKGNSPKEAAKQCLGTSLAIMGKGTLIYTLTMQLSRKEIALIFAGKTLTADGISQGYKAVSNPIHIASEKLAEKISGSGLAATNTGKKLGLDAINGRQLIGGAVTIAVVFGPDIVRTLQGKISTKQLIKNSTIAAAGIAGAATAQAAVPVPVVPAIVGGAVAGMAAKKVLDHFIEDDAKEMFRILKEEFIDMTMLIGLNEEEFEEVSKLTVRNKKLTKMLQKMFQADDHRNYARTEIMQSAITEVVEKRKRITKKEYKQGLIELMAETV